MAFRLAVDMRGTSTPFDVLLMSSIEEVCGAELSAVMLTWQIEAGMYSTTQMNMAMANFITDMGVYRAGKIILAVNRETP